MANNFANSINSNIGASNSGATNTLTVTNPSNTASSSALVNVTVGGTSAGDAFTTYTVAGTTNWSEGVDNSASDAFVISASTALGTTNVVSMSTAGAVSCVLGNLDVTRSASGADVSVTASNTSNTASSTATNYLTVAGTSAGDAQVQYAISGTTTWTQGIDNSVTGDPFVLSASTALGTTNVMVATTAGEITKPLQPAFAAYLASTATNKTGAGTFYTLGTDALTEIFDQGSDFNTNGTFTAPITGRYPLFTNVMVTGCTVAVTFYLYLVTSNRTYATFIGRTASAYDFGSLMSALADMDAADTAIVQVATVGEAGDTDDILGSTSWTNFSGFLAC